MSQFHTLQIAGCRKIDDDQVIHSPGNKKDKTAVQPITCNRSNDAEWSAEQRSQSQARRQGITLGEPVVPLV